MIKKILCSLIIGFGLINFSSAFSLTGDIPGEAFISYGGYSRSYLIDKNLNFRTDSEYKTFFYSFDPGNGVRNRALFWNDGKIAGYGNSTRGYLIAQGYYNTFCYTSITNLNYCNPGNSFTVPSSYQTPIQEFYDLGAIYDSFYFDGGSSSVIPYLCFLSSSRDIASCFYINITNNQGVVNPLDGTPILQGIFDNPGNFDQTKFQDSPFISSLTGNNVIVPVDTVEGYDYIELNTGDYVIMFEEKGYSKDLCYIGTTDLTSKYEDGISYYQGSGYTIFDFYNQLYGVSSFSIHEVGVFINTWFNNYKTFFLGYNRDMDGNPMSSWFYNGPGVYGLNKSNIVNPFLNNLSAYYFLGSTIDFLDNNEYFDGEGLATYCYKKGLLSNVGVQYSIEDDHNSAIDSWAGVSARNNRLIRNQFSGVNEINSQSWDGTILDNYSGVVYTDFNSFFSDSFNRFKGFFAGIDLSDLVLGQIPSYITMFLLAIILFRFLSK